MNLRLITALTLVLALPVGSYLVVKNLSTKAVVMPRRYFHDSVKTVMENGKTRPDTVWHRVRPFKLQNQFGREVSLDEWQGRIIIANFIFTSCPTICPELTRNMRKLQVAFKKTDSLVRFVSFSVDPERDSPARLKSFADRHQVDHDSWWFLTGPKSEVYDIALREFKANIAQAETSDTNFIHTDKFFLLDKDRVVRGWYSGLDSARLDQVIRDVVLLNMERDKKKKRNLFRK
jgi:protein SCO1/2